MKVGGGVQRRVGCWVMLEDGAGIWVRVQLGQSKEKHLISGQWDSSPLTPPARSRQGPTSEDPASPGLLHTVPGGVQDGQPYVPARRRALHHPRAPASHLFSVLRNLLPGWKRCLRLLETECFLLWGWFLQGSGEQR